MDSSSSSIWKYHVFLSFRGEDTRRTIVSHLQRELLRNGLITFKDDLKLENGDSISKELPDAIQRSKFAIVVISENYASSRWCLEELEMIIKCKNKGKLTVIPIFYELDPSDVRKQKGSFAEALKRYEGSEMAEKVLNWKKALFEVAKISGKDSRKCVDEASMIEEIVRDISKRLFSVFPRDSSHLVGIDAHLEAMHTLLHIESEDEIRMIGIWGMGGVGKTTISECVYHRIFHKFQVRCVFRNVKEISESHGMSSLQEHFLSKILNEENVNLWSMEFGSNVIKSRLRHQKVLVILDDVDHIDQLNALAKDYSWFGPGSRIIITTRDKHLLISHGVQLVHQVQCLQHDDALELFSQFAFKQKHPLDGFAELSTRAVQFSGGLPLALRVLGSSLCEMNPPEWESALCRLERTPPRDIMNVLRVSYDRLEEQDKVVFLCIACFYSGEDVNHVTRLLDIYGYSAKISIRILAEKSLIDITNGDIVMHDLLQKMGRELVRQQSVNEPGKRKFLWDPMEICDVLTENTGTKAAEGIILDTSEITELYLHDRAFEGMCNLKFLVFYNCGYGGLCNEKVRVHSTGGLKGLARKLRVLRWDTYPLEALPFGFRPEYLVVLEMRHSNLKKLWEGSPPLANLKKMNLSSSKNLKEIPDLSKATNLEKLDLSYCRSLVEVPSSIKNLDKLTKLYMQDCIKLESLPNNIDLRSLKILNLGGCSSLRRFPEISQSIKRLYLRCTRIEEVPESIGRFSRLVQLDMLECKRLWNIPSTIGNLIALKNLDLRGCMSLRKLPSTITDLKSLESLCLSDCTIEWNIPSAIQKMNSLTALELYGSLFIMEFPHLVGNVESLLIRGKTRQDQPYIFEELNTLTRAITRKTISSFSHFSRFHRLSLARNLYKRDGVPFQCHSLSMFSCLRYLCLRNLNMLEVPQDLGCLSYLLELDLGGNDFKALPASIKRLSTLVTLNLNHCKKLQSLPELPQSLSDLLAHGCVLLERVSHVFKHGLWSLVLSNCFKLDRETHTLAQHMTCTPSQEKKTLFASLPGTQVPGCFKDQTKGHLIKVSLPRICCASESVGFVMCIVVALKRCHHICDFPVKFNWSFRGIHAGKTHVYPMFYPIYHCEERDVESDHIFFFRCNGRPKNLCDELSLEFRLRNGEDDTPSPCCKIKACGVHLLSVRKAEKELEGSTTTDISSWPSMGYRVSLRDLEEQIERENQYQ